MPSRRELLGAVGAAVAAGLAGCNASGSARSSVAACETTAVDHGDGDVLNEVFALIEDGVVALAVPMAVETVRAADVDGLAVRDADGDLVTRIPVDPAHAERGEATGTETPTEAPDRLRYEHVVGERPHHGRYRVAAVAGEDERDHVTVDVNCFEED